MNKELKAKIEAKIRQYPGKTNKQVHDCMRRSNPGIKKSHIGQVRAEIFGQSDPKSESVVSVRPRAHDLSEFRKAHDIPEKIRVELLKMRPRTYVNEEEMRHQCRVAVQNWRRNAELPEFEPHKFKYDGITYWGPVATIQEMKVITGKA